MGDYLERLERLVLFAVVFLDGIVAGDIEGEEVLGGSLRKDTTDVASVR